MKYARIKPVVLKEIRQIKRDKRTLGVLIVVPAFLLVMYGYALNLDVQHLKTIVYDGDNTETSRQFVERFFLAGHSEYFNRVPDAAVPSDVDHALVSGKATVGLVIPKGFGEDVIQGRRSHVQVLVDGVMSSTASTAIGYVEAIFQQQTFDIVNARFSVAGRLPDAPIAYEPRVWYNPELKSAYFLIPGLIAFIMMIITVVATSLSIVRERELGSMEQLMVSPLRPGELILGKLAPYAGISIVSTVLILIASYTMFGMPIKGSYFLLFVATTVYLLGALGMGLLISTLVRSQEVAFLAAALATMLPTFILSGFVFPISNMPAPIKAITYIVPARYFLVVLRGIMLKGVGLEAFGDQLAFLTIFATGMLVLGTFRLKRIMG